MPPTPAEYETCLTRSCLTTPLPELLMVAEKLPEEMLITETSYKEEISSPKTPDSNSNSDTCTSFATPLPKLLIVAEKLPEVLPRAETMLQTETLIKSPILSPKTPRSEKDSDLIYTVSEDRISTSSFSSGSDPEAANEDPRTISDSKFQFQVSEALPPAPSVSSMFIVMYCLLGLTIVLMIILTVLTHISMLLLLSMTIIVFILIVIVTNICVMVYQV
jgi:hypothetical protein